MYEDESHGSGFGSGWIFLILILTVSTDDEHIYTRVWILNRGYLLARECVFVFPSVSRSFSVVLNSSLVLSS